MACDLSPLAVGILKFASVDLLTFMASQVASVHKSAAFISRAAASYAPTHGQHALARIEADPASDRAIPCRTCASPLPARVSLFFLKYFPVERLSANVAADLSTDCHNGDVTRCGGRNCALS